ncbi:11-beta-hydroxysteroid dehydrogenase-like 6 [Sesamum indicum]|uniref:11-beta-hydroxysteroid dehydrogenase-like 6 n=1 Tax=Sesamum indicum TaxID=4182 RepID=A0A6I9SS68_SESIN|nr:11-beta-hydroxysteroid dehydrogenase-like 6 [Sesamum indicum]
MDLVNAFLNIFAPIFTVTTFFVFFPAYLCFKSLHFFWRSIFSENVAGKVVVIAGASSGIGEHVAYEYGKRGAFLVIGARRENALREVAERAYLVGSPRAIPVPSDISKVEDCKTLIQEAINQFGRLDHLVMAAGVTPVSMFEDTFQVTNFAPAMDINFWGLAYATYFAAPYLRMTKGRIVVIASSASWLNAPRLSFYNASKAAVVSFFETLRTEFGSDIRITLVTPGLVESEMTKGKFLDKEGKMVVDQDMRDVVMSAIPIELVGRCAKAIVDGACRGDKYLTVPPWFRTTFFIKMMLPEATDWFNRWFSITEPGIPATEAISKKVVDLPGVKDILWPDSVRSPKIKAN